MNVDNFRKVMLIFYPMFTSSSYKGCISYTLWVLADGKGSSSTNMSWKATFAIHWIKRQNLCRTSHRRLTVVLTLNVLNLINMKLTIMQHMFCLVQSQCSLERTRKLFNINNAFIIRVVTLPVPIIIAFRWSIIRWILIFILILNPVQYSKYLQELARP